MILKCVIVDDEPLALELLETYVQRTPFLLLTGKYSSAVEAMAAPSIQETDVMFLDIQMPDLDGIQFSRLVRKHTRIIFTTAFNQYALEGYRVNALDYLLKPISYPMFLEAANKALDWFELTQEKNAESSTSTTINNDSIYVKSEHKLIRIELKRVLFFEGYKDYVRIYLEGEPKPIYSLISLKTIESSLPTNRFIRTHRSYIVQLDKIKSIESEDVVLQGKHIPISKNYRQLLLNALDGQIVSNKKGGELVRKDL